MINLILTTINVIAFFWYCKLLYIAYKLIRENYSRFLAVFFVFITLQLTCNNKTYRNQFQNNNNIHPIDLTNLKIVESKSKKLILEKTITNTICISYTLYKDSFNKKHLGHYYTSFSGLTGGVNYESQIIHLNKVDKKDKYNYQAIVLEKWNFLGMEFYTKQKNYHGYFTL